LREKLVLIDGHSILNRAFYGVPELTNSEGLHTNAVYGFLNILFKILAEEQPQYLAVAFDLKAPTFRHKMYDAYKGTRKPQPPQLRAGAGHERSADGDGRTASDERRL
jgi:DNA polymerase-1